MSRTEPFCSVRRLLASALLLLAAGSLAADPPCYPEWTNHTFARVAVHLATHGEHLWVGTDGGGILDWDTATGTYEKHTRVAGCLADDWINDIAVDPVTGDVWAATNHGLSMLPGDGSSAGLWTTLDSSGPPFGSDLFTALAVEETGVLWAGTYDAGLYRHEAGTWTRFDTTNSDLSDDFITRIVVDADNRKWIGVWGNGVDVYDDVGWIHHDPGSTEPDPPTCNETCSNILLCPPETLGLISAFAHPLTAGPGREEVWIRDEDDGLCALNGVTRHDAGSWSTFTELNSNLPSAFVDDGAVDISGGVWLASQNGAARWDGSSWTHFQDQRGRGVEALEGEIWLATPTGVVRHDGAVFHPALVPGGLAGARVYDFALLPDGSGAWIGTENGLHRFDGTDWEITDTSNSGIPGDDVRAVLLASNGDLWVGTQAAGAARWDGVSWESFDPGNSGLCCVTIDNLEEGPDGRIWAAYGLGGISVWDGNAWRPPPPGLPSSLVADIARAPNGDLWFATPQGAARFDGSSWYTFTSADGLPADGVRSVHGDPGGDVWIGTIAGVSRFDGIDFENHDVGDNVILAIATDDLGRVWVAARNGGLGRWDAGDWTSIRWEDGLVFERPIALAGGVDERTWIGTEVGLSIYAPVPVPGTVPAGGAPGDQPLRVRKPADPPIRLDLGWGDSCRAEVEDYAVYAGDLGTFAGHLPATCSTAGATAWSLTPPSGGSRYYLVTALAADLEGSYGQASDGSERAASAGSCAARQDRTPCR